MFNVKLNNPDRKTVILTIICVHLLAMLISVGFAALLLIVGNWAWTLPAWASLTPKHIIGVGAIIYVLANTFSGDKG